MNDFEVQVLAQSRVPEEGNMQDDLLANFEDSAIMLSELFLSAAAQSESSSGSFAIGACISHYVVVQRLLASAGTFGNMSRALTQILEEPPADGVAEAVKRLLEHERTHVLENARRLRKRGFASLHRTHQETPVDRELWQPLLAAIDETALPVLDAVAESLPAEEPAPSSEVE